ncbi:uncharacterized protein LOC135112266 isoform X2 [Scylla paramamosain]|uniref:uncharacterized protein LOC135112266 isoform X2 n=1 Tax=Scylla paramamosain TaxID=85552 RepID=UPI0030827F7A
MPGPPSYQLAFCRPYFVHESSRSRYIVWKAASQRPPAAPVRLVPSLAASPLPYPPQSPSACQDSRVIQSAFLHAFQHCSQNTAGRRLPLHVFVGIISMADAFKISRLSGNTESKWKKPWETSMTQEQSHLTGSLVTDRWFRPTGRHDVSATTQGVKPRGGRRAFMRHQLVSSPFSFTTGSEG